MNTICSCGDPQCPYEFKARRNPGGGWRDEGGVVHLVADRCVRAPGESDASWRERVRRFMES